LYGRLMNEGPYAMLSLKLNLLQGDSSRGEVWASVNARIEGGSIQNADPGNGSLNNFRLSQLYVEAGNILLADVTWRLGSLDYYSGDLGLYDMRPAEIFNDVLGLSATYKKANFDVIAAFGDAGYAIRGLQYNTVFSGGVWARAKWPGHLEGGLGAQGYFEPSVAGNKYAPYSTPNVAYEDYVRGEVVQNFLLAHPGEENNFPKPVATQSTSWKVVGYFGFGNLGPLAWSGLYGNLSKQHPKNYATETYNGRDYTLYLHDLTDQRYSVLVGNEMQFHLVPDWVDLNWAVLYGRDMDLANKLQASEANREYYSTVVRAQVYLTDKVHLLLETSVARERSLNGNLWREHEDSVFTSTSGTADSRGLQYGDTDVRNTWQGKGGFVFNPAGRGIYNRPSLRLLYGLQYSNVQAAFGNNFSSSLDQYNQFPGTERHWHSVVALEGEGWF
jgi:hypothetical protein